MKVGIFGGTFNPIHAGHVRAAYEFLKSAGLDSLLVIPDKIPPHKQIDGADDPMLRFEMTKLAIEAHPDHDGRVIVSDMEITSEGKSFTYYTIQKLLAPETELYLYCGTDMLLSLDTWFRAKDFLPCITVAYAGREESSPALAARVQAKKEMLQREFGAKIFDIPLTPVVTSSSEIREMIRAGKDVSHLLTPEVDHFIKERRLYR
ncbi:MAG: nicotinate (nicotinamide) nucleotide adenylyltransferase [Clostridia bacterium]|nr:nicotinate (nicotinamide) nucleotide adenylyltransferase [Clostridia bacterium]